MPIFPEILFRNNAVEVGRALDDLSVFGPLIKKVVSACRHRKNGGGTELNARVLRLFGEDAGIGHKQKTDRFSLERRAEIVFIRIRENASLGKTVEIIDRLVAQANEKVKDISFGKHRLCRRLKNAPCHRLVFSRKIYDVPVGKPELYAAF